MDILFMLLFFISFVCIFIFLIKGFISLIRKNPVKKHFKYSGISVLVMIVSFFGVGLTAEVIAAESITISIPDYQEEYDINTNIPVEVSVLPEDATTSSLKYIASSEILAFSKSGIITGTEEGICEIYIESNGVKSNSISITVVDMEARKAAQEAEEKRLAEEKAAREAEEKRLAEEKAAQEAEEKRLAEEAEKKRLEEEKAAQEAEEKRLAEEAERQRLAEEQAAAQGSEPQDSGNISNPSSNSSNFNTYDNPEQQQTSASYVLNTSSGKFHYPSCKSVKTIAPQNYATSNSSRDDLIAQGYQPCGNCHP